MKRLLVLALALHAAPARANDCVEFASFGRKIELPVGWRLDGADLWNDTLNAKAPIVHVERGDVACASLPADVGTGWKESVYPTAWFTYGYDRYWDHAKKQLHRGCIDAPSGTYVVELALASVADPDDVGVMNIGGWIRKSLDEDLRCAVDEPIPAGGCAALPDLAEQISLPEGWRVFADDSDDGVGENGLHNDRLAGGAVSDVAAILSIRGPFAAPCSDYQLTKMHHEGPDAAHFGSRYARTYLAAFFNAGCLDSPRGSFEVVLNPIVLPAEAVSDPVLLDMTERIADALTTDVCEPTATVVEAPVYETTASPTCIELSGSRMEIQLPAGWSEAADPGEWADQIEYIPPGYSYSTGWVYIDSPDGGSCASSMNLDPEDFTEVGRPASFGERYTRFAEGFALMTFYEGCIDTSSGPVWVRASGAITDAELLAVTEAVADMLQYDIQCPWEATTTVFTSKTPAGAVPSPMPPLRADLELVALAGTMLDVPYDTQELHATVGGSLSAFAFVLEGRLGRGFGDLTELWMRGGVGFGKRTRITATFGIGGRWVETSKSLGLGFRVGGVMPLPKQLWASASIDVGWRAQELEYTVPEPRTELGPFELEPGMTAGVGWRFLTAGVEARELGEFNNGQWVVSGFAGLRYRN